MVLRCDAAPSARKGQSLSLGVSLCLFLGCQTLHCCTCRFLASSVAQRPECLDHVGIDLLCRVCSLLYLLASFYRIPLLSVCSSFLLVIVLALQVPWMYSGGLFCLSCCVILIVLFVVFAPFVISLSLCLAVALIVSTSCCPLPFVCFVAYTQVWGACFLEDLPSRLILCSFLSFWLDVICFSVCWFVRQLCVMFEHALCECQVTLTQQISNGVTERGFCDICVARACTHARCTNDTHAITETTP